MAALERPAVWLSARSNDLYNTVALSPDWFESNRMAASLPEYLSVSADQLGNGHGVNIAVVPDAARLAETMAREMADAMRASRRPTLIVPVGPVDQFPILAQILNAERIDLSDAMLINMDEYLTDDDRWIAADHPLSFRGYMQRAFYDLLDPGLAPPERLRVFPDPRDPGAIAAFIEERGGVDVCFGGIGINGHLAFNEPPEPGESVSAEEFAALPTRVLSLARETRTINANTVGGSIEVVPRRCITVGMREILGARALRFYCNRPWQSAVVRRALHGPIEAACPASLLRTHPDARLTLTRQVAEPPQISLR